MRNQYDGISICMQLRKKPVSYTHLDVYKRQETSNGNVSMENVSFSYVPARKLIEGPVSYTHLDVYKRQGMNKSLGEVFRSAWNTTSHNFKTLFTGLLAYTVPTLLLSICSSAISQNPRMVSLGGTIAILSILYMVFALSLIHI